MRRIVPPDVRFIAWGAFLLALVVREGWIFLVESPYDTIYSDMGGYVDRARELAEGTQRVFPRFHAFYPFGTHYVFAAEFRLLGYDNTVAVRIVHAAMAAAPAYHFVLLASRFFGRRWVLALLGLAFAFWQPNVWFVGFFVSEVPYCFLLYWNAWLAIEFAESRRGGLRLGVTSACLFAIRPQFILTFALLAVFFVLELGPRIFRRYARGAYLRALAPWVLVLGFSAARHRVITGRWGLISENSGMNHVFSDTTISRIEAEWYGPAGDHWTYWFEPPPKELVNEHETVKIPGYIGDVELLEKVRRDFLADKSLAWRIRRAFHNVQLLYRWNDPWPEQGRLENPVRRALQKGFNNVVRMVVLPLAALGVIAAKWRAPLAVIASHLATAVVLSMLFYPEARYRCPYDPMLLILACVGAAALFRTARRVPGSSA